MQALRFDVLALVMEGAEPVTVADFGAARRTFDRSRAHRAAALGGYTGYDLVPRWSRRPASVTTPAGAFRGRVGGPRGPRLRIRERSLHDPPGVDDDTWEAHLHEASPACGPARAAGSRSTS